MTASIELTNLTPVTTILHVRPVGMRANPPSDEVLKSAGNKKTLDPARNYYLRLAGGSVLLTIYAVGAVVGAFFLLGPFAAAFYGFLTIALPCFMIFEHYFPPNNHELEGKITGSGIAKLKSQNSESRTRRVNYPMTVGKDSTHHSSHRQHQTNGFDRRGGQLPSTTGRSY